MTRLALLLCLVVGGCANDHRLENEVRVLYCVGVCSLTEYDSTLKRKQEVTNADQLQGRLIEGAGLVLHGPPRKEGVSPGEREPGEARPGAPAKAAIRRKSDMRVLDDES